MLISEHLLILPIKKIKTNPIVLYDNILDIEIFRMPIHDVNLKERINFNSSKYIKFSRARLLYRRSSFYERCIEAQELGFVCPERLACLLKFAFKFFNEKMLIKFLKCPIFFVCLLMHLNN